MTLTENPRIRLTTLCAMYVAQGMPYGFVNTALAAYLASNGLTTGDIAGVVAMISIPWSFKAIWGPIIDRFGYAPMGRRRPWILFAQCFMVVTIGIMACIPDLENNLKLLSIMVFSHNVFASLQDVSVDALAVDLLSEEERGKANGYMYGCSYLGISIGAAGMALVLGTHGLQAALLSMMIILIVIMGFPLLLRERPGERLLPWTSGSAHPEVIEEAPESLLALFKLAGRAFSLRSTLLAALLAICALVPSGILGPMYNVLFIQDLGWTMEEYASVSGGYAVWLALGGAISGGYAADRFGARRVAAVSATLLLFLIVGFGLSEAHWPNRSFITGYLLIEAALNGFYRVSLFALFMTVSWPKVAGTQFTSYMALLNLSVFFGNTLSGPLDMGLEYAQVMWVAGLGFVAALCILPFIDPKQTRRVLGE